MRKDNILRTKSFHFAVRIIKLSNYLSKDFAEYVLSKQILRSGTSVGASIRESENAESKNDFIHKLNISLKEAGETMYWLELLYEVKLLKPKMFLSLSADCEELIKLLTASIKTVKFNIKKKQEIN